MSQQTFEAFRALSRVDETHEERGYVQHRLEDNQREIWQTLKRGHFALYICGLKGMEQGVDEVLGGLAQAEGEDWEAMKAAFKQQGRWNLEVY